MVKELNNKSLETISLLLQGKIKFIVQDLCIKTFKDYLKDYKQSTYPEILTIPVNFLIRDVDKISFYINSQHIKFFQDYKSAHNYVYQQVKSLIKSDNISKEIVEFANLNNISIPKSKMTRYLKKRKAELNYAIEKIENENIKLSVDIKQNEKKIKEYKNEIEDINRKE